jgi:hypothetical protein
MAYKNTHQARFSKDYVLLIGESEAGTWELLINGLRPFKCTLFSARLSEAEAAAYSSADRYFVEKGIVDPRVPRKEIAWWRIHKSPGRDAPIRDSARHSRLRFGLLFQFLPWSLRRSDTGFLW